MAHAHAQSHFWEVKTVTNLKQTELQRLKTEERKAEDRGYDAKMRK